ncbi:MAG: flagellar basal body-associated FliL family protein [Alkalilacustris sp.]
MGRLIVPLLALLGLVAGAAAGIALKPAPPPSEDAEEAPPVRAIPGLPSTFHAMDNHFIVPLLGPDRTRGLMVLSLSLEVVESELAAVRALEPRLRDAFLRVMFDHANAGGFDGHFTASGQVDALRKALREAAQSLQPGVREVLIVDILRQEGTGN